MTDAAAIAEAHALADAADARSGIVTRAARPEELPGVLARFAATIQAAIRPLPPEAIDAIAELVTARDSAVAELVRLKN